MPQVPSTVMEEDAWIIISTCGVLAKTIISIGPLYTH
jgi:hypothetical protein